MKSPVRILLLALAFATPALMTEAATAPVVATSLAKKPAKVAKKAHKKHRKKKLKKKS